MGWGDGQQNRDGYTNLRGAEDSKLRRLFSRSGTGIQSKTSRLSKPPYVPSDPVKYSNVSSETTSITGHTTDCLDFWIEILKPIMRILFLSFYVIKCLGESESNHGGNRKRKRDRVIPVLFDFVEKWRQPAIGAFDVSVQKGHCLSCGDLGAAQSRSHQTESFLVAQYLYRYRQSLDKLVERSVQVFAVLAGIVDQDYLFKIFGRRLANDTNQSTQQCRVSFVVIDNDYTCSRQVYWILVVFASIDRSTS